MSAEAVDVIFPLRRKSRVPRRNTELASVESHNRYKEFVKMPGLIRPAGCGKACRTGRSEVELSNGGFCRLGYEELLESLEL